MSTMWHRAASAAALALTASTVHAQVETQQIKYAWDIANGNEPVTFDVAQFDDQNGTRILDGVNFELDASYYLAMLAENLEDYAISEGEWFVDTAIFTQLWVDGDIGGIMSGFGFGMFSADLAASDGVYQEGPDSVFWDYRGSDSGSVDIEASETAQFVGDGVIEAGFYPFLSLGISAPPPMFDLSIINHQNSGTMTVSYDYHTVAGPCTWDLDKDGNVGTGDLIALLGSWGNPYGTQDLIELLGNWGKCPR